MSKKGRRGKYHEWITEEGLLKIEGWARDGLTDEQIAHNMGIAVSTLNNWKNRFVEIMESLKRGKEVIDRQVENALLKRALGYEYEEVKIIVEKDDKGRDKKRQEKTIKKVIPDTTAQIFWLKNRKPDEWRDKPDASIDIARLEQIKANTKYIEEKTKLLEGVDMDMSLLKSLIDVENEIDE